MMRLAAIAVLLISIPASAAELRVIAVSGAVTALHEGQGHAVRAGDTLRTPLAIKTAGGASIQIRTEDGSQVSLGESTETRFSDAERTLVHVRGELTLWSEDRPWAIDAAGSPLRAHGYLRLKTCADGCAQRQGVYGKGSGGELVAEYAGGRAVLRDRLFLLPAGGGKAEVLPRDTGFLNGPPRFDAAVAAKVVTAQEIKAGLEAFKTGRFDEAKMALDSVRAKAAGEVIVSYYLGLIALEQQRNSDALRELQRYAKEDANGAREREVSKLLTLLTTDELQREVATAIRQEKSIAALPPEPGSIAVQTFANRTSPANASLAKGIAAMIISDLGKVPGLKVLERQKVQKINDEIRLSASGLVEGDSMVRAGRLMRAERVVVGSMGIE
jgi:hypothetical protein